MELCTASVAAQYLDIADIYAGDDKLFVELIPAAKIDSLNDRGVLLLDFRISRKPMRSAENPIG